MISDIHPRMYSTYSIVARDPESGSFGVAVQTHQMCVGAAVPWARSGVGAIATQSLSNVRFGPLGLTMLEEGLGAFEVIEALVASDAKARYRQVAVVDRWGIAAAWTGGSCIAEAGHHVGEGYSVQANMMVREGVIPAMAGAYERSTDAFETRLMAALRAAQGVGGDIRGMQSAAMLIVAGETEGERPVRTRRASFDLRVDEHDEPLEELDRLVRLRRAELLSRRGDRAAKAGQLEEALQIWESARGLAPELEEMAFWQALTLSDELGEVEKAALILSPVLKKEPNRTAWVDLIDRLVECGLLENPEASKALIAALNAP